jgi:hypothetical protein
MKKIALYLISAFICNNVHCQIIEGTVLDSETKSPISFATIYFSGTFAGTYSDNNGNFTLDISGNTSKPLTISAVGYYSTSPSEFSPGEHVTIYLIPKVYELKGIVVNARSMARQRKANMIFFKDTFLGTTTNARHCKIMNEDDIRFIYDKDSSILKAISLNPIIIENMALGYKVTYYLDEFELNTHTGTMSFSGNIIFDEDLSIDEGQKKIFERRRKSTYLGSRMHFFRSLWSNDLNTNKFIIQNSAGENLDYKNIVVREDSLIKFLIYYEKLYIWYYTSQPVTIITFLKVAALFDKSGYFDPKAILWEGPMARQRVADWLPYEYSILK